MVEVFFEFWGVYMYDIDNVGNILIKEGVFFFVDGD